MKAVAETEAEKAAREALKKKVSAANRNSSQNLARPPWPRPVGGGPS